MPRHRFFNLALSTTLLIQICLPVQALHLVDLPEGHPAASAVQKAIQRYQLFEAYPDQTFRGEAPFTRYQLAQASFQMLRYLQASKKIQIETPLLQFGAYRILLQENGGDLPKRHWAIGAVQELFAHGLISAENNKFQGPLKVNRYALAAQIYRFLNWLNLEPLKTEASALPPFATDLPEQHWARPAVESLLEQGILTLDSQGRFQGDQPANGYELASSLVKAIEIIEKSSPRETLHPQDPHLPVSRVQIRRDGRFLP